MHNNGEQKILQIIEGLTEVTHATLTKLKHQIHDTSKSSEEYYKKLAGQCYKLALTLSKIIDNTNKLKPTNREENQLEGHTNQSDQEIIERYFIAKYKTKKDKASD